MPSVFLQKDQEYAIISIRWANPYTEPPGHAPKILWGVCVPWPNGDKAFIRSLASKYCKDAPCGYSLFYTFGGLKSIKRWSAKRMAENRLRLLKNRVLKNDPLFADEFIRRAIAEKPDYYCPEAIALEVEQRRGREAAAEARFLDQWVFDSRPR